MRDKAVEVWVGLFMLLSIAAILVLALKVSGLTNGIGSNSYTVSANFDNIGGLKVRSSVTLAGVRIGQVSEIKLDSSRFKAIVKMQLDANQEKLPVDTAASIQTKGLLGANYISLIPGFEQNFLKEGSIIENTHSALILEDLIGQFAFSVKKSGEK